MLEKEAFDFPGFLKYYFLLMFAKSNIIIAMCQSFYSLDSFYFQSSGWNLFVNLFYLLMLCTLYCNKDIISISLFF